MQDSIGEAVEFDADAAHGQSASNKPKTKRNVRFLITEGGDVVSESVRFEKHGMPRSKATEAVECLLAGNERFRKVCKHKMGQAKFLQSSPSTGRKLD